MAHLPLDFEVGIPSKVTLGDPEEVQVVEDYYLTGASQDEAGSAHPR
jgi:hypothetical protein